MEKPEYNFPKLPLNIVEDTLKNKRDAQWRGKIGDTTVEIYYDDKISERAGENQYAVFTEKGFLGWLPLGFTQADIQSMVEKYKDNPSDYEKEFKEFQFGGDVTDSEVGMRVRLKTGETATIIEETELPVGEKKYKIEFKDKSTKEISAAEIERYIPRFNKGGDLEFERVGKAIKLLESKGYEINAGMLGGWRVEKDRIYKGKFSDKELIELAIEEGFETAVVMENGGEAKVLNETQVPDETEFDTDENEDTDFEDFIDEYENGGFVTTRFIREIEKSNSYHFGVEYKGRKIQGLVELSEKLIPNENFDFEQSQGKEMEEEFEFFEDVEIADLTDEDFSEIKSRIVRLITKGNFRQMAKGGEAYMPVLTAKKLEDIKAYAKANNTDLYDRIYELEVSMGKNLPKMKKYVAEALDEYKVQHRNFVIGGASNEYEASQMLKNFDINTLDAFERQQYDHFVKQSSKQEALQLLINTVEGDYSQLSPNLAVIAEKQHPQEFRYGGSVADAMTTITKMEIVPAPGITSFVIMGDQSKFRQELVEKRYVYVDVSPETKTSVHISIQLGENRYALNGYKVEGLSYLERVHTSFLEGTRSAVFYLKPKSLKEIHVQIEESMKRYFPFMDLNGFVLKVYDKPIIRQLKEADVQNAKQSESKIRIKELAEYLKGQTDEQLKRRYDFVIQQLSVPSVQDKAELEQEAKIIAEERVKRQMQTKKTSVASSADADAEAQAQRIRILKLKTEQEGLKKVAEKGGTVEKTESVTIVPYQYNGSNYKEQTVWVDTKYKHPDPSHIMLWGYGEIDDTVSDFSKAFTKSGKGITLEYNVPRFSTANQEKGIRANTIREYIGQPKYDHSTMKKGGGMRSAEEINKIEAEAREKVNKMSPKQITDTWNKKSGVLSQISETQVAINPEYYKFYLAMLLTETQLTEAEQAHYFAKGGGVGRGYKVFNYTDNIYATDEVFSKHKDAKEFIVAFRKRFEKQGYYRDNRWRKLKPSEIDLLVIPENFSPYSGKTEGEKSMAKGGGVSDLEKELHKLQRDLNSSRLQIYIEGDTSEEEIARQKERAEKLARFNEVLQLLREKDSKYASFGGAIAKRGGLGEDKGRTPDDIWSNWTNKQRTQFLQEHADQINIKSLNISHTSKLAYNDLPIDVKYVIKTHRLWYAKGGSMATGGGVGMEVELEAHPNPDYPYSDWRGTVKIKKHRVPVKSFQHASEVVEKFIEDNQLGGGNFNDGIIYKNGTAIARVSYNGRVWEGTEYTGKDKEIHFSKGGDVYATVKGMSDEEVAEMYPLFFEGAKIKAGEVDNLKRMKLAEKMQEQNEVPELEMMAKGGYLKNLTSEEREEYLKLMDRYRSGDLEKDYKHFTANMKRIEELQSKFEKGGTAGRLCPIGTQIQTLLFNKENFSKAEAKKWAKKHDFNFGKVDVKTNHFRLRQQNPSAFKEDTFRTIHLTQGVSAVIACPIEKKEKGGEAWFKEAVEAKAPYELGGWRKELPSEKRRKAAISSRPKNWGRKKKYLSVATALQALSNVQQDEETKRIAKEDADYFFAKAKSGKNKLAKTHHKISIPKYAQVD